MNDSAVNDSAMDDSAVNDEARGTHATSGKSVGRRRFLTTGAAALAAGAVGLSVLDAPGAKAATTSPEGDDWIHLSDYTTGNGTTDDSAGFQNALKAATAGSTVIGQRNATYLISGTLDVPADRIRIDLNQATIKSATPTVIQVNGKTGVRIMNGTLSSTVATAGVAKILLAGCTRCTVENLDADCGGGGFVAVQAGTDNRVIGNHVVNGGVTIASTATASVIDTLVDANAFDGAPADAVAVAGAAGQPAMRIRCSNNTIRNHKGAAFTENSFGYATEIVGNNITPPATTAPATVAINVSGQGPAVKSNDIVNPKGTAIQLVATGARCAANRIAWDAAPAAGGPSQVGIVVLAAPSTAPEQLASILGNEVLNSSIGISLSSAAAVAVTGNFVNEASQTAIDASQARGAVLAGNTIRWITAPTVPTRYGVRIGPGGVASSTQIAYGAASGSATTTDIPISVAGDQVTLVGNVADGGFRTDGKIVGGAESPGPRGGAILNANNFRNGASFDLSGLTAPVLVANAGSLLNAGKPTLSSGVSNGLTPPAPTLSATSVDRGGVVSFGSGVAPVAGTQVKVVYSAPLDVTPTVTLTPDNQATAALGLYVTDVGPGGFSIGTANAPAAGQAATTYVVQYRASRNQ